MAQAATVTLPLEIRTLLAGLATAEVAEEQKWIIALLRKNGYPVLSALWRMLGSEPEVLDAYQTAVCRLTIRGRHGVGANPGGYFYRTAIHCAIETLRARQRQKAHWPQLLAAHERREQSSGIDTFDQQEMLERMRQAICQLPEYLRNVIILRDLAQLPYAQVGRILNIRSDTARTYRRQAVVRLADLIGQGCEL